MACTCATSVRPRSFHRAAVTGPTPGSALSGKPASEEQIRAAAATGADLIVWNHEKIGRGQIALIHSLGKKAWAYTIDDPARARQLMNYGLDGIITNKPAIMVGVRDAARK